MEETIPLLLVDAEEADAWNLRRDISRADPRYEIVAVRSLGEARHATAAGDFRCVLSANALPDGKAADLLAELGPHGIPLIVLSPRWDARLAQRLLSAGADDFVVRPETDTARLVRAIELAVWRFQTREPDLTSLILHTPPPTPRPDDPEARASGSYGTASAALLVRRARLLARLEARAGFDEGFLDRNSVGDLYALAPALGWTEHRLAQETADALGLPLVTDVDEASVDFRFLPPAITALKRCIPLDDGCHRRLIVANPYDPDLASFLETHALGLQIAAPSTIASYLARPLHAPPGEEDEPLPVLPGLRVLRKLGAGGTAVVYQATQEVLERDVAVKVLAADTSTRTQRERFRREAQVLALLDHPAIIRIYDTFERDGDQYNVIEYASGGSLHEVLARHGPLPEEIAASIVATAAEALWSAARHGIVHRDVKPGNLLLTSEGAVKLGDFGLSIRPDCEERLTRAGHLHGTAAYMAPEYWLDGYADHRSDLYSLGCTMFELLTARSPFQGSSVELMVHHVGSAPPAIDALRAGLSKRSRELISALLRKDPDARPADGKAVAAALAPLRARVGPTEIRSLL